MAQYTRGEAAGLLAAALAMPGQKDWLAGWSANEIQCGVGCSHPQNNLWACGQKMPGSSSWNSAGVQNYPSLAEGVAAVVLNLADPNYPAYQRMVHDLQIGKTDSANIREGLRTWCGSTCYSNSAAQFPATGKQHSSDPFEDSGGGSGTLLDIQSCKQCKIGAIGGCPSGYFCAPSTSASPGFGCCLPNQSPGDVVGSIFNFSIAGWDAKRVLKFVLGLVVLGFGLLLLLGIVTEKGTQYVQSSPAVKGASKIVAAVG